MAKTAWLLPLGTAGEGHCSFVELQNCCIGKDIFTKSERLIVLVFHKEVIDAMIIYEMFTYASLFVRIPLCFCVAAL